MLKFVQGAVIALFVAWISVGSWHSWQLSLNDHQKTSTKEQQSADKGSRQIWMPNVVAPGQKAGENHELTDAQKRETTQKEQELAIQRDIARFNHQLVIATWVLGIIGFGTGIVLYFSLQAARTAVEHIPRVERAYVFGGPARIDYIPGGLRYFLNLGNYGKTPAFVKSISINLRRKNEIGRTPQYFNWTPDYLVIQPGEPQEQVRYFVDFLGDDREVFYCRFLYDDIFGDRHFSGFIHQLSMQGSHPIVGVDAEEYWKWT